MTNQELLKYLGNIRSEYIMEAQKLRSGEAKATIRKLPRKRMLLIAAVIALTLLLVGCVAAIVGLHELKIGTFSYKGLNGEPTSGEFISLQGYTGSDNYRAAQEWMQFLDQYDPDRALLHASEESGYVPPIDYKSYFCYTPDMVKQVDEICSKYHLEMRGPSYTANSSEEQFAALGIDGIAAPSKDCGVRLLGGYYYRDGSFQIEGDLEFPEDGAFFPDGVCFQYRCVRKTTFDDVVLNIGNSELYDQWNYTTRDGTQVLLAQSWGKSLIIADTEDFFITINICDQITGLEMVADTFTFTDTPQRPDPDTLVAPEWYSETTMEETTMSQSDSGGITVGQSTLNYVAVWYQWKYPEKEIKAALDDIDGNGFDDLAVWYDGAFRALYITDEEDRVKAEYLFENGFEFYESYSQMFLQVRYDGNLIYTIEKKGNVTYQKFGTLGSNFHLRECFKFDPNGTQSNYFVSVLDSWDTPYDAEITQWEPVTEAEYAQRLGAYTIQAYDLKDISEYDLQ